MTPPPRVDQGQVTTAIAAGRSAAHGDDAAAAEGTLRLARLGGPDAVTFLSPYCPHRGIGDGGAARACGMRSAGGRRFPFV